MIRHLWAVCSKADTLWINWVHTYVIKDQSVWQVKIPHEASWTIRKIFKLRANVQPWIKCVIGDGKATFLWFDNWHSLGPLYQRFGESVVFNLG
ncbi:hypothetical protein RHMOL_Rhmol08G0214000 [Rhododendron molle]|uniref:Uncharacterized protein n=1 Tax=Rhododendron molle TaxID=49168 RepID=A0ACC0MRZ4_RHOML|nr:hypothetical protein RHMOL_Rhmol08G0214000 [Rhododendron molle]